MTVVDALSFEQWKAVIVIVGMMAAFLWGRFRYDLVALATLLIAVAIGVVPIKSMFTGFADDIVIIVGSALVVSAGIARSNAMDGVARYLIPSGSSVRLKLAALVGIVALLSAVIKNIGALAIMMPIAFNVARQSKVRASVFLMPMAFASLLGGLMTLVGTSPNTVVARVREDITGEPFKMFDYTPVGFLLVVAGLTLMVFVRLQRSWDGMYDLKNGGFLAHRSPMENEDETEIQTTGSNLSADCQRHPPRNTQAPLC